MTRPGVVLYASSYATSYASLAPLVFLFERGETEESVSRDRIIASGCKTLASPAQPALVEHAASDHLCYAALSI